MEVWSGKKPSMSYLKVFGCIAYAKVPNAWRMKLEAKAMKCLFLEYCEGTRACKLMCLEIGKIIQC